MTPRVETVDHESTSSFDAASNKKAMTTRPQTPTPPCRTIKSDPALSFHDDDDDAPRSAPATPRGRRLSFDDRVTVHEFDRDSHASCSSLASSLQQGLREKLPMIKSLSDPANMKAMTSNIMPVEITCPQNTINSPTSHLRPVRHVDVRQPPEQYENDENESFQINGVDYKFQRSLGREIRRVLLVDPHDIFLKLLSKSLRQALPHVTIVTAHSSQEALQCYEKQGAANTFDIIVSEERLSLFHRHQISSCEASGSALLQHFARIQHERTSKPSTSLLQPKKSLLIGISAHFQKDRERMEAGGADFCWAKAPTPNLQAPGLLEGLLRAILIKRERHAVLEDVFGTAAQRQEVAVHSVQ